MKRTGRLCHRRGHGNHFHICVALSAIAGEHSFDAFASLATGAFNVSLATGTFDVFATGVGAPLTVPAFFAAIAGKAATAVGAPMAARVNEMCIASSAASAPRTARHLGWRVAHIVQ
jgi:hypothetical protein